MPIASKGQGQPQSDGWFQWTWRIARLFLVPCLIVLLFLMIFEESFIFFPHKYDGSQYWQPAGLSYEDVFFEADDGTKLHGWYCPHDSPRAVVLFAHGNAGNITHRADVVGRLQRMGMSVFLFDYRGYGRSEGRPDGKGILADARAARQKLSELAGVRPQDIVLMGRSLGGAVAVDLAAEDGARGLIVESTFSSMADVAAVHYPWLPVRMLLRTRLDSISKIGNYHGPFLQSHGQRDRTIPYRLGRSLYEAAPPADGAGKWFYTVEGADHNNPQPTEYYELLSDFIDQLP